RRSGGAGQEGQEPARPDPPPARGSAPGGCRRPSGNPRSTGALVLGAAGGRFTARPRPAPRRPRPVDRTPPRHGPGTCGPLEGANRPPAAGRRPAALGGVRRLGAARPDQFRPVAVVPRPDPGHGGGGPGRCRVALWPGGPGTGAIGPAGPAALPRPG